MASGVAVDDEVINLFNDIKKHRKQKAAFFRLSDDKTKIIVDHCMKVMCDDADPFKSFKDMLPKDDCRFIVYDALFDTEDSKNREQMIFISWAPDTATVQKKMIHASSRENIKKLFGLTAEWQVNDLCEVQPEDLAERLSRDTVVCIDGKVLPGKCG
ncbi:cofilin-2-like [Corythoichthys intestinalis]|uniref:cofilin-2-like n=1 Tax=Corythoichthys intestinalis TaxID=161448 RepID=UPI0025A54B98|nr:cofilin-2-like [Corythoichthys intestinalis]